MGFIGNVSNKALIPEWEYICSLLHWSSELKPKKHTLRANILTLIIPSVN